MCLGVTPIHVLSKGENELLESKVKTLKGQQQMNGELRRQLAIMQVCVCVCVCVCARARARIRGQRPLPLCNTLCVQHRNNCGTQTPPYNNNLPRRVTMMPLREFTLGDGWPKVGGTRTMMRCVCVVCVCEREREV